jgi:hypothetical protein
LTERERLASTEAERAYKDLAREERLARWN